MQFRQNNRSRTPTLYQKNETELDQFEIRQLKKTQKFLNPPQQYLYQECILSQASIEKLNLYPAFKIEQKNSRGTNVGNMKESLGTGRGYSTPSHKRINNDPKCSNCNSREKDRKKVKQERESTRDRSHYRQLSSDGKNSNKTHKNFCQYNELSAEQRLAEIQPLCKKLSYRIGYLKAEIKETKKELEEQREKRKKETRYLAIMAQKYKAQAQKYKKLLKKTNISVVQCMGDFGNYEIIQGQRYSHI